MKKLFALLMTVALLLGLGACSDGLSDNPPAPTTVAAPDPFATARRIVIKADLRYDNENKPIIEPGEVLARFHYMDTFDAEAWRASTIIQVAWSIETINHAISLDGLGIALQKSEVNDGSYIFGHAEDYGFGAALSETWMLPEAEFTAAFNALMAEAKGAEAKDFWLIPNNYSGILNPVYDTDTSFRIDSYLPEQLRPNAEPIHMSTELMRKHFPFLGKEGTTPSKSTMTTGTQVPPQQSTMPTSKTLSEGQTRPDLAIRQEAKKDGLLLQVEADYAYKFTGEPFILTATITNTTGHDITYGAGSGMRNVHQEIQVHIRGKNGAEFTDMDIYGKIMTADMKLDTLKAGETFTETIRFLPGAPRSDSEIDLQDIDWFPAGEYKGTAEFMYFTGTMENPGEQKKLQLEFSVILFN